MFLIILILLILHFILLLYVKSLEKEIVKMQNEMKVIKIIVFDTHENGGRWQRDKQNN